MGERASFLPNQVNKLIDKALSKQSCQFLAQQVLDRRKKNASQKPGGADMCEFKYCRVKGMCFLRKSSPCPARANNSQPPGLAMRTVQSLRLKYDGFLDLDALIAVLEMGHTPLPPNAPFDAIEIAPRKPARPQPQCEAIDAESHDVSRHLENQPFPAKTARDIRALPS